MSTYPHPHERAAASAVDWRLRAEIAERRLAEAERLRTEAERRAEVLRCTAISWREYMRRADIPPAAKVLGLSMAWRMGFGPGVLPPEREQEWIPLYREHLAEDTGLDVGAISDWVGSMTRARWFRRRPHWGTHPVRKTPMLTMEYSWPDGLSWTQTWGNPALLPPLETPTRHRNEALSAARKKSEETVRSQQNGRRADSARPSEDPPDSATCPFCGAHDPQIICRCCGSQATLGDLLTSTHAHGRADSAPPSDGSADVSDGVEETHSYQEVWDEGEAETEEEQENVWNNDEEEDEGQGTEEFPGIGDLSLDGRAESARWENGGDEGGIYLKERNLNRGKSARPSGDAAPAGPAEPDPLMEDEDGISEPFETVVDELPSPLPSAEEALQAAVERLLPAVEQFPNHLAMQRRQVPEDKKYRTVHTSLTAALVGQHLRGEAVLGAGLFWPDTEKGSGRAARVIAWDSDEDFGRLISAACKLRREDFLPLLVKNPSKPNSGHLWLLFDGDVDPSRAFAVAEHIVPALQGVKERFPRSDQTDGARLRLPGGHYLPVAAPPVTVQVGLAPRYGPVTWHSGTSVEGWVTIAAAISPAERLTAVWVTAAERARFAPRVLAPPQTGRVPRSSSQVHDSGFFARFNIDHPVQSQVRVGRHGVFRSPWHEDATPSCKLYRDGHWCDFSRDRRGGDAFDLYAALNGFWSDDATRPDRKAAMRFYLDQQCHRGGGD